MPDLPYATQQDFEWFARLARRFFADVPFDPEEALGINSREDQVRFRMVLYGVSRSQAEEELED